MGSRTSGEKVFKSCFDLGVPYPKNFTLGKGWIFRLPKFSTAADSTVLQVGEGIPWEFYTNFYE